MSGHRGGHRVRAALHRLDPLAPDWLVRIVAPKPAPTPWADMARVALTVTGVLAAGIASGHVAFGALLGIGALTGAFGDQGGPFRQRATRIAAGIGGALCGLVLGRLLPGGLLAVPFLAAAGVVSAYVSAIGAVASFAGLQFLVLLAVASGIGPAPLGPLLLAFVVGAGWSTLLSGVQAALLPDRTGPRYATAAAVDRLDDLLADVRASRDDAGSRTALAASIASGLDVVTGARAVSSGRRDDLRRLASVLQALPAVARAAAAAIRRSPRSVDGLEPRIARVRQRVLSGATPTTPVVDPPLPTDEATARAILRLERLAGEPDPSAPARPPVPLRARLAALVERLAGGRTAVFAARLGLTLAVAGVLLRSLPLMHSYWLLLTVAVVLKPDLGSVFARGVQRTLGTLVGVALGTAVLVLVPPGPLLLVPVAVFAGLFPIGAKRNYGMLSTFVTPLVLILVDLSGGPTRGLAATRLLDTALGAAVVLLVGYLPWPSTWRPRLGRDVASCVDALASYAGVAVDGPQGAIGPARRRAYAALQDLRGDLQSALAEPPPRSRYAAAWWPIAGQLEQLADDLRDASVLERDRDRDRRADRDRAPTGSGPIVLALREIASSMRARRPATRTGLPERGPLLRAGEDVAALRGLLEGPRPSV